MSKERIKKRIKALYDGDSRSAVRFRYAILIADIITIAFLIISTFFYGHEAVQLLDIIFGTYILADYSARAWIAKKRYSFFINPLNIADLISLVSFLAPFLGENFAFLRAIRIIRLLRSYRLLERLRKDFTYFKRNEDIILSGINLLIFIFIMTETVFVTQIGRNPDVKNFIDAMYFTVGALTTTGFGDITLQGQTGKAISIIIMIFGVSLFLRLMQAVFRPVKVRFKCTDCGLFQHERDAVHCKHCGKILDIASDGGV